MCWQPRRAVALQCIPADLSTLALSRSQRPRRRMWCIMVEDKRSGAQGCIVGRALHRLLPLQKLVPKGVDVVYDPVGGKSFEEALKVVKWGAQILIIGFASGDIPKVTPAGELPGRCEGRLVPAEVCSDRFSVLCCGEMLLDVVRAVFGLSRA